MSIGQFVAGAWGGKGLSAWLLTTEGDVLDQIRSEAGLSSVTNREFGSALRSVCAPWLQQHPGLPFVLSGMVGARGGWLEIAYAECPLSLTALAAAAGHVRAGASGVTLLPGAICRRPDGHADVMRGEELQILGIAASEGISDAVISIPGTHAKAAVLEGGAITSFKSYATGELFDLLIKGSLVAALAEGAEFDSDACADGVARGAREALSHAIFAARASVLGGRLPPSAVNSYLSGVLIGAELGDAHRIQSTELVLLASGLLAERYGFALETLGRDYRLVDAKQAALAGFKALGPLMATEFS